MEKTIYFESLQKSLKFEMWDSHKAKKSKSYLNASDCCGVKLEQEKHCSACQSGEGKAFSGGKTQRKIVKVGKKEHLFPVQAVEQALEQMEEQEEIKFHSILKGLPTEFMDRVEAVMYAAPAEKRAKDYKETQGFLQGNYAVGTMVLRGHEFEVVGYVGQDSIIRVARLVEERNMNTKPTIDMQAVEVNADVVALERTILERKATEMYDFSKFMDTRAQIEEQVIEDVVLHGKVPEVQPRMAVVEKQEMSELERLKKLAGV